MVKIGDMNLNLDQIVEDTGYSEEFLKSEILKKFDETGNLIGSIKDICDMAKANSLKQGGGDNG